VPEALAKRAKAAHAARVERLVRQGRESIREVHTARVAVATNYFLMGQALAVLKTDGVAEALGRASFAELCAEDLDMTEASANRLIEMVGRMRRATLELLGRDRANAMLSLVDATPADDTVDEVVEATLTLPSGDKLVVADASTAEIYAAAKAFRDARPAPKGKAPKGFTTTADERARYARAAKRWQRDDVKALVDARLVASRKAHGAIVRVEMPLAIWEQLRPPKA